MPQAQMALLPGIFAQSQQIVFMQFQPRLDAERNDMVNLQCRYGTTSSAPTLPRQMPAPDLGPVLAAFVTAQGKPLGGFGEWINHGRVPLIAAVTAASVTALRASVPLL